MRPPLSWPRLRVLLPAGLWILLGASGCLRFETPGCGPETPCGQGELCSPEGACIPSDPGCALDGEGCGPTCIACAGRCTFHGPSERIEAVQCIDGRLALECAADHLLVGGECRPSPRRESIWPAGPPDEAPELVSMIATRAQELLVVDLGSSVPGDPGDTLRVHRLAEGTRTWSTATLVARPGQAFYDPILREGPEGVVHLFVRGWLTATSEAILIDFRREGQAWIESTVPGPPERQGGWGSIHYYDLIGTPEGFLGMVQEQVGAAIPYAYPRTVLHQDGSGWRHEVFAEDVSYFLGPVRLVLDPGSGLPSLYTTAAPDFPNRLAWWERGSLGWTDRSHELPTVEPTEFFSVAHARDLIGICTGWKTTGADDSNQREVLLHPGWDPLRGPLQDAASAGPGWSESCTVLADAGRERIEVAYFDDLISTLHLDTHDPGTGRSTTALLAHLNGLEPVGRLLGAHLGGSLHLVYYESSPAALTYDPVHLWIDP